MASLSLIKKNFNLSQLTTFKIGGEASFFCEIKNKKELIEAVNFIATKKLDFLVLGGGSNLLISDSGFDGLVLKLNYQKIKFASGLITAGAGVMLNRIIHEAKKIKLGGLEWAYGIPANIGGATRNNAGAFNSDMGSIIESVKVFDLNESKFKNIKNKDCFFDYRSSVFQKNKNLIIWEVNFILEKKPKAIIESLIRENLAYRKKFQPLEFPSAGSFFKNPSIENIDEEKKNKLIEDFIQKEMTENNSSKNRREVLEKIKLKQSLPAGYFIDHLELKGHSIGDAQISKKHANFIINTGKAKAEDVVILSSLIKQKVREKFGLQLFEEVEMIGF